MPQLGVKGHEAKQFIRGRLNGPFKMVGAIAGVVNKNKHVKGDLKGTIWSAVASTMSALGVTVKQGAGYENPVSWRFSTALGSFPEQCRLFDFDHF